jgi:Protein of unknown function (DUF2970).
MFDAIKAVLWSFLGIRRRADYDVDRKKLKMGQVIIAGIFCALVFVVGLVLLVRFIVAK